MPTLSCKSPRLFITLHKSISITMKRITLYIAFIIIASMSMLAQTKIYRGNSTYSSDILYSWDGRYLYRGNSSYTSDIIATWDGRFLYRGRSNYSSDTLYTFDGKYIYQGRSNYTSDTVATWSNNRLYAGYSVYTSDIIYRVNGVFPPILFVFL